MTDLHYHFRQGCLRHIQEFYSQSLEVPGDLELTDIHKNHLRQQFGQGIEEILLPALGKLKLNLTFFYSALFIMLQILNYTQFSNNEQSR